jgi:recombination protein RecA
MVKQRNAAVVFTNQIRDDINKMGFGPKTTTSGGRALRFYASLRLEVARIAWIANSEKVRTGMTLKITVNKNKVGVPQRNTEVQYFFDRGFDKGVDAIRALMSTGALRQVGHSYYNGETEIGGEEEAIAFALSNVATHGETKVIK